MQLPIFLTQFKDLSLMQSKWSSILNPFLDNSSLQSIILPNITLINGTTIIDHKLGRKLIGWRIIRLRADASIYDTQDSNQTPTLTLRLVSNMQVVVDLEVM